MKGKGYKRLMVRAGVDSVSWHPGRSGGPVSRHIDMVGFLKWWVSPTGP